VRCARMGRPNVHAITLVAHAAGTPARHGLLRDTPPGEIVVVPAGASLEWAADHRPATMPVWGPWDFWWSAFLAAGFALLWFLRGLHVVRPSERLPAWRICCFLAGLAAIYCVLLTRFEYLAQHMFFLNRIQHLVMHHLDPFLIALSWPGAAIFRGMPAVVQRAGTSLRCGWLLRIVQQPIVSVVLFEGLLVLWLVPPITFRAMFDWRLYEVMNASMVVDGLLFWFLVLDPRPDPPAPVAFFTRAALAFVIIFPQIALGTWIGLVRTNLYPSFSLCGRVYPGIDPLLDQQIGGLILWVPAGMMSALKRRHRDRPAGGKRFRNRVPEGRRGDPAGNVRPVAGVGRGPGARLAGQGTRGRGGVLGRTADQPADRGHDGEAAADIAGVIHGRKPRARPVPAQRDRLERRPGPITPEWTAFRGHRPFHRPPVRSPEASRPIRPAGSDTG
jgi:putative membrane protein